MFTVDEVISQHFPALSDRKNVMRLARPLLRRLLHEDEFRAFALDYPHLQGIEFIEQALEYFSFSCSVADRERENIPSTGRLVVVANHPIGSLDGLALLKLIHEIRSDVRVVANDLLWGLQPLRSCLLPVRVLSGKNTKSHILRITQALQNDEAVIFFPAGEVSRLSPKGIRDSRWRSGFLKVAEQVKAPVLPVYIDAHNSIPFYLISLLIKPLSTLLLVNEMFRQQERQIKMRIGRQVPFARYGRMNLSRRETVKLFKNHVYRLGAGKKPIFAGESPIARPERKTEVRRALGEAQYLGATPDCKQIYLFQPNTSSPLMREIGRLREETFRAVGEGTGRRRDLDQYDYHYQHLVLWDDEDLEIAGAYRFVDAGKTLSERGTDGLYSASLFVYDKTSFFLEQGLELGRSFVQQRYWGKRSLDYLWYGIGAYLANNPCYRYLFGPVSISNALPELAKELLIYFYALYFGGQEQHSCSRNPFRFSTPQNDLAKQFCGNDYREDLRRLKSQLDNLGAAIPPLYKQYAELCEPGGVVFLDFNVDPEFGSCVDGLVIVDTERLKPKKRARYIETNILSAGEIQTAAWSRTSALSGCQRDDRH